MHELAGTSLGAVAIALATAAVVLIFAARRRARDRFLAEAGLADVDDEEYFSGLQAAIRSDPDVDWARQAIEEVTRWSLGQQTLLHNWRHQPVPSSTER